MKIPWNKFKTWQVRLAVIVGIIISVSYLQPKAVIAIKFISGIVQFQLQIPQYEKKMQIFANYIEVAKGLAKSQMIKVDSLSRYADVEIDGKIKERKADIYIGHSGDCKVFIEDGSVGMYGAYYNYTESNWEYYDFENKHILTYIKIIGN